MAIRTQYSMIRVACSNVPLQCDQPCLPTHARVYLVAITIKRNGV